MWRLVDAAINSSSCKNPVNDDPCLFMPRSWNSLGIQESSNFFFLRGAEERSLRLGDGQDLGRNCTQSLCGISYRNINQVSPQHLLQFLPFFGFFFFTQFLLSLAHNTWWWSDFDNTCWHHRPLPATFDISPSSFHVFLPSHRNFFGGILPAVLRSPSINIQPPAEENRGQSSPSPNRETRPRNQKGYTLGRVSSSL